MGVDGGHVSWVWVKVVGRKKKLMMSLLEYPRRQRLFMSGFRYWLSRFFFLIGCAKAKYPRSAKKKKNSDTYGTLG